MSRARTSARESRADVRAAIVAAARAELAAGAYRELTVDTVMERVGLTRTAFYRYFDDLGALVQALLEQAMRPLGAAVDRLAAGAAHADEEAFRAALAASVRVFAEHGPALAATVAAAHHDASVEAVVAAMRERFVTATAEGVRARASAGRLDIPDPLETARAMTAMNEHYLLDVFAGGARLSPGEALAALWPPWRQLLFRG